MRTIVLQHIACEPPGGYEDVLRERDWELARVELDEGERIPVWRDFDAIVAMGGPMSVNDDDAFPWLAGEKKVIADAVRSGLPFFGACLGVQLLAAALGARVYSGPRAEVGLLPVVLTGAAHSDPLFAGLPDELLTFQWHGDTFDLPQGAVLLATSAAYPNQAFRWGTRAYGVQFHLEVFPEMAREWGRVPEYAASLERTVGPDGGERLLEDLAGRANELLGHARALFSRWLDLAESSAGRLSRERARSDP
ncbi:MAG: type 1 glutamine amidotransferase [Actinobacteria bacterium]|nr:MAG: type 1 glutamine amidotransferase [Actinomycetota bacterium]